MPMTTALRRNAGQVLLVLHAAFLLTGTLHAIGGPLLPSLASNFHLSDAQSGELLSFYFVGTSLGALLCAGKHVRLMTGGFLSVMAICVAIAAAQAAWLRPLFFVLGLSVGMLMSAVSIVTGREFGERSAAPLTFLNFTWSAGALLAPLLAARLLVNHNFRAGYLVLAGLAALAALACALVLDEPPQAAGPADHAQSVSNLRLIALFAFLTFLEVGIENTTVTWLATYSMRSARTGAAVGAISSSLYWWGFLLSRGVLALLLLRVSAMKVLRIALATALAASVMLVGFSDPGPRVAAMLVLGVALAPVFPLLISRFFAFAPRASDSRWVLACCGFGGSVLPWLTGWISTRAGELRFGLLVIPAALCIMVCMLPLLRGQPADKMRRA